MGFKTFVWFDDMRPTRVRCKVQIPQALLGQLQALQDFWAARAKKMIGGRAKKESHGKTTINSGSGMSTSGMSTCEHQVGSRQRCRTTSA